MSFLIQALPAGRLPTFPASRILTLHPVPESRPVGEGFRDFLRAVARRTSADTSWHGELGRRLQPVHAALLRGEITREQLAAMRRELGPAFHGPGTCQGLAASRSPLGLADPDVLDRIHRARVAEEPEYAPWDGYFQAEPGVRAIRSRAKYFADWLDGKVAEAGGREVRLVSVASGPGHEVGAYYRSYPEARVRAWCVDPSPRALERAREVCGIGGDRVGYVAENAVRHVPPVGVSLVWSSGMLDQLGDRLVVVTLGRLWKALPAGGEIVLGNMSPANSSRAYWEVMADWAPLQRRAEDLVELARQAGIPAGSVRVGSEPLGLNLFLHVDKRG